MQTKKYTYDYDGKIIFNETKINNKNGIKNENTINIKYGVSEGPTNISNHYSHILGKKPKSKDLN